MNTKYDIEAWAGQTELGRRIFNYNFHLNAKEFKGWVLIKTVQLSNAPGVNETAYFFENKLDPKQEIFRIDIAERYSWHQAQSSMLQSLNNSMRPAIPNGTKRLSEIGDVNFVSRLPESGIPSAISFVRGNISVIINNVAEKKSDLSEVAIQLDETLSKPPTSGKIKKEKIRVIKPSASKIKSNGVFDLIKSLPKLAPKKTWLQIIASDGELRRDGDVLIYAPDPNGAKHVDIFASIRE